MIRSGWRYLSGLRSGLQSGLQVAGLVLLCVVLYALPVRADAHDSVTLVPMGSRSFVALSALNVTVDLVCVEADCAFQVEQVYTLNNRDQIKDADIAITAAQGTRATYLSIETSFAGGAQGRESGPDTWTLSLAPTASTTVRLRYTLPTEGRHLIHWDWDSSGLSAWGPLTSARIALRLPPAAGDALIFSQNPLPDGVMGDELYWEYESPPALEPFDLWFVHPATWQQLADLPSQQQHEALASLYQAIRQEALERDAPYPDPYTRIVAELELALDQNETPALYLALADLYLSRAEELPGQAQNYYLLAADTMETALAAFPADASLGQRLSDVYSTLSQYAREAGDPAQALAYIQKAEDLVPGDLEIDGATLEEMTLEWAADLAAKGGVSEALMQTADVLSPRIQDALYRYAPPVTASRTQVLLTPGARTATYQFYLYPPMANQTSAHARILMDKANALPGTEATFASLGTDIAPQIRLSLTVEYDSLQELIDRSETIARLADIEPDMVQGLILTPWINAMQAYYVTRTNWSDHYVYQEQPAFDLLRDLRDEQAEYTTWRLVEIGSAQPQDDLARSEQQLTALALREQRQIWDNLSASSYWSYHVQFEAPSALPVMTWLVGWGQERQLVISHRHFDWLAIGQTLVFIGGIVVFLLGLVLLVRRLLRRVRNRQPSEA